MLAPEWTWWDASPVILVAVALLWLPGAALASGLGAGRWPTVAIAPVLTGSLVTVGGVLFGWAGVAWRPASFLIWLVGVPAVVWGVRLLVTALRRGSRRRIGGLGVADPPVWAVVAGLVTAAFIGTCVIALSAGAPGNVPQGNDTIYHLALLRSFVDSGNISSPTADAVNNPTAPAFYPALLHGLAASVMMLTHAPGPIALHAVLVAATALVWPVGLMFLVHAVLGADRRLVYLTGALSWVFSSFPAGLLGYGPVWPTVLGYAYVPAVVAIFAIGLRQVMSRSTAVVAVVLLALMVPGLVVAHVSAFFVAAIGALLLTLAATWRHARVVTGAARRGHPVSAIRRWLPFGMVVLGAVAAFAVLTVVAPSGMVETAYGRTTLSQGLVAAVTLWGPPRSRLTLAGTVLLVVTVLGAVTMIRRKVGGWLAVGWVGLALLGFLAHVQPAGRFWPLTWPWYNVPARIQGTAAVFGVPLVAYGMSALLAGAARVRVTRMRRVGVVVVQVVLALLVAVQAVNGVRMLQPYYVPRANNVWITAEEADDLRQFSAMLPDDAVVAADPFTGAAFLAVVGPERTFIPTEKAYSPDMTLVSEGLTRVRVDPTVCQAVQRNRIDYAITGGRRTLEAYGGIDRVGPADGFVQVAQAGPYTLWRVPACTA
ncbi:DUF6541 family protein [Raineyella sp. LH-20]|uniref:DUF6541 family protein n=1 Tax=Raineyella sp. LH-20 TaxID=3081204 RepID=UPI002952C778|nr:DUF6541 family protein [Raineyella sp. LH-20]WOP20098.1 DUF6541 family protein [Raineyella sp. LH-20]